MKKVDLSVYDILTTNDIYHNISYNDLFDHELGSDTKAVETSSGAVAIDTGVFTGRSPKDKYIVKTKTVEKNVWWSKDGSDNQPIDLNTWEHLKEITTRHLNDKKLYVMDGYCGANKETRLKVRLVTEIAWMAHFFKNMFIRPTESELVDFIPDWTILNACKTKCNDYKKFGLNSPTYIAFNIDEKMTLIGNTWYGGEIKKGIFSIMNYFLPLKGIGSFHCSANLGEDNDTALFFGLSGTGKTTLSADGSRLLIGDDEHGWDDNGIFNLEGGCYAKTINLSAESEPDIYNAIKKDALLENVVLNNDNSVDYASSKKTENTRVSYPIYHIKNHVKPFSCGGHPQKIIFLTCDAYGILPPIAKLSTEQAMYYYLSGYTAKIPGTELGITEPKAVFSSCFGQPFLLLNPIEYAKILGEKIKKHGSQCYMVNTGWTGGSFGVGNRISIKDTRGIIDAILNDEINEEKYIEDINFGFKVPTQVDGINNNILDVRSTWKDKEDYDKKCKNLVNLFINNFNKFDDSDIGSSLINFGPKI